MQMVSIFPTDVFYLAVEFQVFAITDMHIFVSDEILVGQEEDWTVELFFEFFIAERKDPRI